MSINFICIIKISRHAVVGLNSLASILLFKISQILVDFVLPSGSLKLNNGEFVKQVGCKPGVKERGGRYGRAVVNRKRKK